MLKVGGVAFLVLFQLVWGEITLKLLNPSEKAGSKVTFKIESNADQLKLKSMKNGEGTAIATDVVRAHLLWCGWSGLMVVGIEKRKRRGLQC